MSTIKEIKEIIDNFTNVNNDITSETSLSIDLGLSSLSFFELISIIEKKFNIKIKDKDIANFYTVGDLVNYIDNNTIENNKKRPSAIDLAKGLCIFGLPLVHLIEQFFYASAIDTKVFDPSFLLALACFGPGIFLICMGYDIKTNTKPKKLLQTGISLLIIGFIVNIFRFALTYLFIGIALNNMKKAIDVIGMVMLESDIYFVAGLFYLLLAFLKKIKLNEIGILIVTIFMLAIGSFITNEVSINVSTMTFAGFLGNFFYVDANSIFPILNYAIFPVIGMLISHKQRIENLSVKQLLLKLLLISAILASIYVIMWCLGLDIYKITISPLNDYKADAFNIAIQICLALFVIYALELIIRLTKENKVEKCLYDLSYYLMPFFIIHWIIIGFITALVFIFAYESNSIPFYIIFLISVVVLVLSLFLSIKFGKKLMTLLIKLSTFNYTKQTNVATLENKTFKTLIDREAKCNKNKIAYESINDSITRYELKKSSCKIASYLESLGYVNQNIAILCEKSINWIKSFYGIIYGSNKAVLINNAIVLDKLISELKLTDSKLIIYPNSYKELILKIKEKDNSFKYLSFEELLENSKRIKNIKITLANEDDTACILFTSGTTDESKAVKLSHLNLISNLQSAYITNKESGWKSVYNIISILPLYHAFSLSFSILFPLYVGGKSYLSEGINSLNEEIKTFKPSYLVLVPKLLEMLVHVNGSENLKEKLGGALGHIFCGGAALSKNVIEVYKNSGIELCNGYGITECSPLVSYNPNASIDETCIGYPIKDVIVKISDINEILVKGDNVSSGYYNNEKATKDAFIDGFFKTGDLGYFDEEGKLHIKGRLKNLIILSNGENISPEVVEKEFKKYEFINDCLLKQEDDKLVLEVFTNSNDEQIKKIVEDVNMKLPSFFRINKYILRNTDFDRTPTGKIIRNN